HMFSLTDTTPTYISTLSLQRRSSDLSIYLAGIVLQEPAHQIDVMAGHVHHDTAAFGNITAVQKGFRIRIRIHAGSFHQIRRTDGDRKSTRLNSSHVSISYAVFCLKKK